MAVTSLALKPLALLTKQAVAGPTELLKMSAKMAKAGSSNDGDGGFTDCGWLLDTYNAQLRPQVAADIDGDGDIDLLGSTHPVEVRNIRHKEARNTPFSS